MSTQIYLDCDEAVFGASKIMVTIPKRKIYIRRKQHYVPAPSMGEIVDAAVREWCANLGIPVPPEQLVGASMDAQEAEQAVTDEKILETEKATGAGPKPEFGTPEFWAWARKRRVEENAARAEKGLPPLPTAKEKAAAKEAKAAAKAAKDALKK